MSYSVGMRIGVLFAGCLLPALAQVAAQRNELVLRVEPACALTEVSTAVSGRVPDGAYILITGSTRFSYLLRTSRQVGAAEIVQIFDPPPGGGPAVISYTVSLLPNAIARNNGTTTPGVSAPVASFGANAHTSRAGAQGQIVWTWRGPNTAVVESPSPKLSIFCR
jgi:hypothetical protein